MPNGEYIVQDMDELEEALRDGVISREQFDLAIVTKDKLVGGILKDMDKLKSDCLNLVEIIENN
jgi:predicted RNA-binding protein associated with RNAse of E/G family